MAHLRPIHDEASYAQMVALMGSLLDVVGDDEDHALSGLLELVGDVVSKYEREHNAIEPAAPKDSLRFLMEVRGLNQEDLSTIVPLFQNQNPARPTKPNLAPHLSRPLAPSYPQVKTPVYRLGFCFRAPSHTHL